MFSQPPILTETGLTVLLRAAGGEKFTFTKFQAGNGYLSQGETPKTMTALKNVIVDDIGITQTENTEEEGFIRITGTFDNQTDVQQDFIWTELGLIIEDEDGNEYLYAYGYDDMYADLIKAGGSEVIIEQYISFIVAIGETDNITAYVLPNASWATKAEFDAHVAATGNVHGLTVSDIHAAEEEHNHNASDITGGILPVARGGTGVNSLSELAEALGIHFVTGSYVGDNAKSRNIDLGFQPIAVIYCDESGCFADDIKGTAGGFLIRGFPQYVWDIGYGSGTSRTDAYKVAEIVSNGFTVYDNGTTNHTGIRANRKNTRYFYIAF